MPTKNFSFTYSMGGQRNLSPQDFTGQVGSWLKKQIFPPEVWRNFGSSLSRFLREEGERTKNQLVDNIINRYWQFDIENNPVYGRKAGQNPKSPPGNGKRLIELLSELEANFDKSTDSSGIESVFSIDLRPVIEGTSINAKSGFPYIFAQEFGNFHFEGKHFLLNETGDGPHEEDEELFQDLIERLKVRILRSLGKRSK